MEKEKNTSRQFWAEILRIAVTILTAVATSLGIMSCLPVA